tara:strand:- start:223 stop:483 length:261 start_codon:yes stop_codon:yes gene_type:complete
MSRYYCPYCSSRYQFQRIRSDGCLICGHCGDLLIKKRLINSKQILGFIAAFSFLAPLILMTVFVLKDFNKDQLPINYESLVLLTMP